MANGDWYPKRLADRIPWHANFAAQAGVSGTSHGLTAAQVTQAGVDSTNVASTVNWLQAVDDYSQAVTEFKNLILEGDLGIAMPTLPAVPTNPAYGVGSAPSIEARTRQLAAIVKASVGYTESIGELYGIVAPAAPPAGVPSLVGTALTASQVSLAVSKAGHALVAIDSRRGGGAWEQIGVAQVATFIDDRAPLVAGQPELREYRAQAMENNVRVGAVSAIISVVTVP